MVSLVQSSIYLDISMCQYLNIYRVSTFLYMLPFKVFIAPSPSSASSHYLDASVSKHLMVLVQSSIYLDISMCQYLDIYRVSTLLFTCHPTGFYCTSQFMFSFSSFMLFTSPLRGRSGCLFVCTSGPPKPVLLQQLVCSVRCSSQLHWLARVCPRVY